ncbi:MAG: DUF2892 domain-containing protein [Methanobacterium sp.]|jgi:hypothetical protein
MLKNVGKIDQTVRLIAGVILIVVSLFGVGNVLQIIFLILGILMIVTGATSFCPVYLLFKYDSVHQKEKNE